MKILAVDTTSDRINMAIGDGTKAIQRSISARGAHDEKLFGEADRLLKKARCKLHELDGLAVASGPGSFTGIRVGMTFVSVLAQILKKPAAAVSLLEAQAHLTWNRAPMRDVEGVAAVFPSARDELFFQLFIANKSGLAPSSEPRWVTAADWPKAFAADSAGRKIALCGPAAAGASRHLRKSELWLSPTLSAADLIAPALRKLEAGERELAPLYLKPAYYERNPPKLVR